MVVPDITNPVFVGMIRGAERAAGEAGYTLLLGELGHSTITYLAGPETSYADALRWRGLREAGIELGLRVRRLGPTRPTLAGGAALVPDWLEYRSSAVVAYNAPPHHLGHPTGAPGGDRDQPSAEHGWGE